MFRDRFEFVTSCDFKNSEYATAICKLARITVEVPPKKANTSNTSLLASCFFVFRAIHVDCRLV